MEKSKDDQEVVEDDSEDINVRDSVDGIVKDLAKLRGELDPSIIWKERRALYYKGLVLSFLKVCSPTFLFVCLGLVEFYIRINICSFDFCSFLRSLVNICCL